MIFARAGFPGWETGFCKRPNFETGAVLPAEINPRIEHFFATAVQGSERPTSRKRGGSKREKLRMVLLTRHGVSSLVVDALGDEASEKNIVACFYFDFAARKEHSLTAMLGALLRQIVGGLAEIPEEIVEAYSRHKRVAGGREPQLSEILEMLQTASASQRIFICVDALDECAADLQGVLESLQEILKRSPGTRLFLSGRSHIRNGTRILFAETATFMEIKLNRSDIFTYILAKLEEDTNKDAMNASLKEAILYKVPPVVSGMYVGGDSGRS